MTVPVLYQDQVALIQQDDQVKVVILFAGQKGDPSNFVALIDPADVQHNNIRILTIGKDFTITDLNNGNFKLDINPSSTTWDSLKPTPITNADSLIVSSKQFTKNLSALDNTVLKALKTLDQLSLATQASKNPGAYDCAAKEIVFNTPTEMENSYTYFLLPTPDRTTYINSAEVYVTEAFPAQLNSISVNACLYAGSQSLIGSDVLDIQHTGKYVVNFNFKTLQINGPVYVQFNTLVGASAGALFAMLKYSAL